VASVGDAKSTPGARAALVTRARGGEVSTGVLGEGRSHYQAVAVPVRADGHLVGVLMLGAEIGTALKKRRVPFHVDGVQAPGLLPLDVKALNIDLLSLSAHKFYGPKGIGLLYARRAVGLKPQIVGGNQQAHRRAGTEPIALIVGLAEALRLAEANARRR
jgi:cysteine desulfurase